MKHTKMKIALVILTLVLLALPVVGLLAACDSREKVIIYTSAEDYRMADMQAVLDEHFPDYNIQLVYKSTGDHGAQLSAYGTKTECDITFDLDYSYLEKLDKAGYLADLSEYDRDIYVDDVNVSNNYIIENRLGAAIILNTEVLAERNLPEPTCYQDLLKQEYHGLISMASPKSSGTGYMFLKSLVNTWGEDEAFEYFDSLAENILHFTTSGSGPVKDLKNKEVAIGLGITGQAVTELNNGAPFKIIFFEEGSPYTLYGEAIIKGKETRQCVKEVFDFIINEYIERNCKLFLPEKVFKDKDFVIENFPTNIKYADMSNNNIEEKERLLDKWNH